MKYLLLLCFSFIFLGKAFAQPQTLELSSSSQVSSTNGPNQTAKVLTLYTNTNNPSGTTFIPSATKTTFSLSNQQFSKIEGNATTPGLNFGGTTGGGNTVASASDFLTQGNVGSPSIGQFSSSALNIGSGISTTNNYAMSMMMYADALINASGNNLYDTAAKVYYGNLTVTFNTPVSNPIFHVSGMGGDTYKISPSDSTSWAYLGYAARLELATGSAYKLSMLSGSTYFSVSDTSVENNSPHKGYSTPGEDKYTLGSVTATLPYKTYAASGSFMVIGTGITSITFRMYMVGDGGASNGTYTASNIKWGYTTETDGDRFSLGVDVPLTQSLSGTIFNDVNSTSNAAIDGSPISIASGKQLYVSLVDNSGAIVKTIPVNADGTYNFIGLLLPNSTYKVVLDTLAAGSTTSGLPADWYNTSEAINPAYQDGTNNGIITVAVATSDVAGVNFGIQQPPTAVTDTLPSQVNPGGTNSVTIPATKFDGNDQSGGVVDSITIASFPTNATSITINGVIYTSSTFPAGGVTVPTDANGNPTQTIAIDPIDGAVTSVITYTATDNAGAKSAPATVSVPFTTLSISGTVYNDNNGGTPDGTVPPTVTVKLYDSSNNLIATTTTDASGNYTFPGLNAGKYNVVITDPTGFSNVSSTDATPLDGSTSVTLTSTNTTGVNFGINQPPTANTATTPSQINPGGTTQVTVPATNFGGTDPNAGIITSITITTFPSNVNSIIINGTTYTSATFPPGGVTIPTNSSGNPTQTITIDPIDGTVTPVISYTTTDNAGLTSVPATVSVPFTNDVPTANTDSTTTGPNTPVTIPVLNNDSFGADSSSKGPITITNPPRNGTAVVNNGGTPNDPTDDVITYTPNNGFLGKDTLIYQICDRNGDCDTAMAIINVTIPLPVSLISFNAGINGTNVNLNWNVAQQISVKEYEVLFSTDGVHFNSIGNITATNTSSYAFTHTSPVSGNDYYKIKAVNENGSYTYSLVQIIHVGNNDSKISIMPNPVSNQLHIITSDVNSIKEIKLTDVTGKLIYINSTEKDGINMSNYIPGVYILQIINANDEIQTEKIIKQ